MSTFPPKLAWLTLCMSTAATLAAVLLFVREGAPSVPTLLVFAVLVAVAAHLPVGLRNGVFISPSFLACMAAIVVFSSQHSLLGATLVCSLAHFRVSNLRRRLWGWIPFNASLSALSFLAAALVFDLCGAGTVYSVPLAAVAVLPAALAYIAVAWSLIVASYVCEGTRRPKDVVAELLPAGAEVLPFALLGFFVGRLYLDLGAGVLVTIIVPILIAREMFRSYTRVAEAQDETVHMLIRALEAKDPYTAGHAERVAKYASYIGEEMKFGRRRIERLSLAALMHDIGKLVVPNGVLNKPGKLTEEEFRQVRVHEKVAVQMLSHIDFLRPIAGTGHSDRMRFAPDRSDRPIEPYIVMIADAFDAMTSTRAYRKALPQEVAIQELRDKAGAQFHPECVEALIRALERRGEKHGAGYEVAATFENAPDVGVGSAGLGDLLKTD